MKKFLLLICAIFVLLLLSACGKSESVKYVESLIADIGDVSLESKDAIESAKNAFDNLSAEEKADVKNYYILVESMSTFEELEGMAKHAAAQQVYNDIKAAWNLADIISGDLYNVWHGWVFEKDKLAAGGLQYFVDETSLSMSEVIEGFAARNYINEEYAKTGVTWMDVSEDRKEFFRKSTVEIFDRAVKAIQYVGLEDALFGTINAYLLNGDWSKANEDLSVAKEGLKELGDNYDHYTDLISFYTTTSALVDFCKSPSGSFDQYKVLLNDYRKESRDLMNVLDLVFE